MLIVEVVTIFFFYPETHGLTLEEIKIVFDGPSDEMMGAMGVDPGKQEAVAQVEDAHEADRTT